MIDDEFLRNFCDVMMFVGGLLLLEEYGWWFVSVFGMFWWISFYV